MQTRSLTPLIYVGYLIPASVVVVFIWKFYVNVPYMDQWELVPLFEKVMHGQASFGDFFVRHNEHRIVIPRLIIVALGLASQWTIALELASSGLLALITIGLLLFLSNGVTITKHSALSLIAGLTTSVVFWSLIQQENWLWGFQISWFLVNACFVGAIAYLKQADFSCKPNAGFKALVPAALLCGMASFSSGQGLFTWIALLPSLVQRVWDVPQRSRAIGLWLAAFLLTALLYQVGYTAGPTQSGPISLPAVGLFWSYWLGLFGNALLYRSPQAYLFGWLLVVNWVGFAGLFIQQFRRLGDQLAPWISLGLFALMVAGVTAIARAEELGVKQALSSRYTTISILLVIAVIQLWRVVIQERHLLEWPIRHPLTTYAGISSLLTLLVTISSINAIPAAQTYQTRLQRAETCLELGVDRAPDDCLKILYPIAAPVRQRFQTLVSLGLRPAPEPIRIHEQPNQTWGKMDTIPPILPVKYACNTCDPVTIQGWAAGPQAAHDSAFVFLGQTPDRLLGSGTLRPNQKSGSWPRSWRIKLKPTDLPSGRLILRAWIYDPQQHRLVRLPGERILQVE